MHRFKQFLASKTKLNMVKKSLKFRFRYFIFSKYGLQSTSFLSLVFEKFLRWFSSYLENRFLVRLSVGLVPKEKIFLDSRDFWTFVLHGKINDSTYLMQTIEGLRKSFPQSILIVASYEEDISKEIYQNFADNSVFFLGVEDPGSTPAPFANNFVRSIQTANAGLNYAKSMGAVMVVKLRVDQRMSNLEGLRLVELLLAKKIVDRPIRIIGTSYNSYTQIPLGFSDMLHFGRVDDLLIYWSPCTNHEIDVFTFSLFNNASQDISQFRFVPEVWLACRFMNSLGYEITGVQELSTIFWMELAGIIDSKTLGQNWSKTLDVFDTNYHSVKWFEESFSGLYKEIHFDEWLIASINYTDDNPKNYKQN
jgi:hypothetical protein